MSSIVLAAVNGPAPQYADPKTGCPEGEISSMYQQHDMKPRSALVNTVKHRTHSLFRQGHMLYEHIPNWPPERLRPLLDEFAAVLAEHRLYKRMFAIL